MGVNIGFVSGDRYKKFFDQKELKNKDVFCVECF